MTELIPNRFLFDFEFPLRRLAAPMRLDGRLRGWSDAYRLPDLHAVDGVSPFAPVWAAWDETGLYVACRVEGKREPVRCDPAVYWRSDCLRLCIDTRDTRTIRRASRYCRQLFLMPAGGGPGKDRPAGGAPRFTRAREHAPDVAASRLKVAAEVTPDGYALEAYIPGTVLHGFDPAEHPRIGFYYILEDQELGQQFLTIGDDLHWYIDPSTWATAVLAPGGP
jgi:hypothetical protein